MTEHEIRAVLDELTGKVEEMWGRHEAWEAAHPNQYRPLVCEGIGLVGRCTDTSVWIADRLGGVIYGYVHKDNPSAEIGAIEFGHDFLIIDDRWLVDWWAADTYQYRDLYDLNNPDDLALVHELYGDPGRWRAMDDVTFARYRQYIKTLREDGT